MWLKELLGAIVTFKGQAIPKSLIMMLCWFLIALGIAPIAGQEGATFETNFVPAKKIEAIPLRNSACFVPGTSYNEKAKRCVCSPNKAGDPDFCCYDPKKETACIMRADPQVTSFDNFKVGINVPCGSGLCQLEGPNKLTGNIYVAPIEIEGGRMYPSRAEIDLVSNSDYLNIKLNPESPAGYEATSLGYEKEIKYNKKYNFYTIRIQKDLLVTARLVKNTNVKQPRVPGMCIVKPKPVIVSSDSYCGLSKNITLMKPDDKSSARIAPWKSVAKNQKINNPKYNQMCQDFGKWSIKCPKPMLSSCSVIVYDPEVRKCLYHEGKGDIRLIKALNKCLSFLCVATFKSVCRKNMAADPEFRKCLPNASSFCG